MTEQTQPTDAELEATWTDATGSSILPYPDDMLAFARAVLAKWGTPAGAGEPLFWYRPVCGGDMYEGPFHTNSADAKKLRAYKPDEWKPLFTTPQPTQAQAGAVPLTRYRVLEPRVDRIEADDEYLQDDAQTWATDPNGTFVGTIYGYALRAARRRIKGADHG